MNNKKIIKKEFEQRPLVFDKRISNENNCLMTIEELSSWLKIKISTIYMMVHKRRIPFIKVGKLLRFDHHKIEAWLDRSSHVNY